MYNFINDKYKIDFPVPAGLQEIMGEAEKEDKRNSLGMYLSWADAIDVDAKNCYAAGLITKKQWNIICARYEQ